MFKEDRSRFRFIQKTEIVAQLGKLGRECGSLFQGIDEGGHDVLAKEGFSVDLEARSGLDPMVRGDGDRSP